MTESSMATAEAGSDRVNPPVMALPLASLLRAARPVRPLAVLFAPRLVAMLDVGQVRFAGHSKWSKIKHAKGDADRAKSTVNTKISKEIGSAVKGECCTFVHGAGGCERGA